MKKIFPVFGMLIMLSWGCQKGSPNTYTVQGYFFNGTANAPWANQTFSAILDGHNGIYPLAHHVEGINTDSTGKFKFTYTNDTMWSYLTLNFGLRQLELRAEKNIDSTFIVSSLGKIRINLATTAPLEAHNDTLFIAYYNTSGIVVWDTITHTLNGFYKELIFAPTSANISYGRGYNQIHSWPWYNDRFVSYKSKIVSITGDPIVDAATINY